MPLLALTEDLYAVVGTVGDEHVILACHVHVVRLVELTAIGAQFTKGAKELARQVEHADSLKDNEGWG